MSEVVDMNLIQDIKAKVNEINEILKDTKIEMICKQLETLADALKAVVSEAKYAFTLQLNCTERYVSVNYRDLLVAYLEVNPETTISEIFKKLFTQSYTKEQLAEKIYRTISELADELAQKANIVKQLRELQQQVEDLEKRLDP